jgi:hypothetical protein
MTNYRHAECAMCGKRDYCSPLHGDKGGPPCCIVCIGKWHGEYGRRRRLGRIVIRAMAAYFDGGGSWTDVEKLKMSAMGKEFGDWDLDSLFDPLGYLADTANTSDETIELTSELLADAIKIAHPDLHPPEGRDLAQRVSQALIALQPFTFPAQKPKPVAPPPSDDAKSWRRESKSNKPKAKPTRYPCVDCADAVPADYCDACRAEYDRREQEKFERRTAKQRAQYARRRKELLATRPPMVCAFCGEGFESKRADGRYCSDRCRQQAHRKPVTDKATHPRRALFSRDRLEGAILALLDRHRAIYQNDLLPAKRTSAQYQAVSLVAAKLEAEGKIETFSYLVRWGYPGSKVLVKPGHIIKDRKIALLKDDERLKTGC